jgi:hypothetical protein
VLCKMLMVQMYVSLGVMCCGISKLQGKCGAATLSEKSKVLIK